MKAPSNKKKDLKESENNIKRNIIIIISSVLLIVAIFYAIFFVAISYNFVKDVQNTAGGSTINPWETAP